MWARRSASYSECSAEQVADVRSQFVCVVYDAMLGQGPDRFVGCRADRQPGDGDAAQRRFGDREPGILCGISPFITVVEDHAVTDDDDQLMISTGSGGHDVRRVPDRGAKPGESGRPDTQ